MIAAGAPVRGRRAGFLPARDSSECINRTRPSLCSHNLPLETRGVAGREREREREIEELPQ